MADPLSLLPYALGGSGGQVNGIPVSQLIASGLTLLQRSPALVRSLSGRRSAILLPTCPQFFIALAASEGRGAVLINPLASPIEIAYQIADSGVGAIFTIASLAPRLPRGITHVLLDEAPRKATVVSADEMTDVDLGAHFGLDLEGDTRIEGADEEAVIVYTSAMAGRPLGAILTHRNILANARATMEATENTSHDNSLAILPFSHLFGLVVSGIAPLLVGGRVLTMERFNATRAIDLVEREAITEIVAVPAVFAAMSAAIARRGGQLNAPELRLCICGGAELRQDIQSRWAEQAGAEIREGYGLTEAGPVCLFNRPSRPNRPSTMGLPLPGVEVGIFDPQSGGIVPAGSTGEICVSGPNVSPGYVSGGEAGLGRRDGWLRTGDLGVRHPDGTVSFRGVLKAMFTRNGFNIYPAEIEGAVRELPGVDRATVFAIPNSARENDIRLEVSGTQSADAIRDWCNIRLSAYKQPTEIAVV